jgi:hypothetical protein
VTVVPEAHNEVVVPRPVPVRPLPGRVNGSSSRPGEVEGVTTVIESEAGRLGPGGRADPRHGPHGVPQGSERGALLGSRCGGERHHGAVPGAPARLRARQWRGRGGRLQPWPGQLRASGGRPPHRGDLPRHGVEPGQRSLRCPRTGQPGPPAAGRGAAAGEPDRRGGAVHVGRRVLEDDVGRSRDRATWAGDTVHWTRLAPIGEDDAISWRTVGGFDAELSTLAGALRDMPMVTCPWMQPGASCRRRAGCTTSPSSPSDPPRAHD